MVLRILAFLSRAFPTLKRRFWRGGYELLARRYQHSDWRFMNYGFAALDGSDPARSASPHDEPEWLCLQLYQHVADQKLLQGRDVVEVGCGRGGGASFLARVHEPRRVIGIDFSEDAIKLCQRHARPNLTFLVGDAEALPIADESVDVVLSVESSHCYGSIPRFLTETRRVLRPGGSLLLADFRTRESIGALRRELHSSGMAVVREQVITPNVVWALDLDSDRRDALIRSLVPRPLWKIARTFAGVRGTATYDALRTGRCQYLSLELRRAG